MGTDIHMVSQYKGPTGQWITDKFDVYSIRNSKVFDILGCRDPAYTFFEGAPIRPPKGLPSDFEHTVTRDEELLAEGLSNGHVYHQDFYMGWFGFSHLTLRELQSFDWNQPWPGHPNAVIKEAVQDLFVYLEHLSTQHGGNENVRIVFGYDT